MSQTEVTDTSAAPEAEITYADVGSGSPAPVGTLLDSAAPEHATSPDPALTPEAEDYELSLPELPHGVNVSPEDMATFSTFAKGSKLSREQAQAVLDYGVQQNATAIEKMAQIKMQWEKSVKGDRELGGDNLDATVQTANMAIKAYDSSGTISRLLRDSGYGSNPDVVKFLYNVGKGIGEDIVPNAGISGKEELPLHERMYPSNK